ncbi:MAG: type I-E CRISPR-associated protein Cas5/CasD [Betaproteobacteria bacterium]|nr:type I-E CRISPR-associated protein Cas5/CasD [Betaproteobacteria bacterium]
MRYLLFTPYAPLASWGDVAVGEFRPSFNYPSRSAVLGLLGAALGLDRGDEDAHEALHIGYGVAVAVYEDGRLLRDYHTAQVPGTSSMKGRPHRTRADELAVLRDDLNTILSTRDYRQDAVNLICLWSKADPARWTLDELNAALNEPRFVLYLGRKSCPPALPLNPEIVEADDIQAALAQTEPRLEKLAAQLVRKMPLTLRRVAWEDGAKPGYQVTFSVPRKDDVRSRRRWQFGDRAEHVALIAPEDLAIEDDA